MKITLAGYPGSGKSILRNRLVKTFKITPKATGDFMREMAKSKGYNDITKFLVEFVSEHPEVDHQIDEEQKKYGQQNDDFVLDAHLGFYFVPDSLKILLKCTPEESGKRIFEAKRETEEATNLKESIAASQKRFETMKHNFMKLYGVDFSDEKNFDVVVDTSNLTPDEVYNQVSDAIISKFDLK